VAAVILGVVADGIDLEAAMLACAAGPVLAAVLTLVLPPSGRMQKRLEPAAAPL
jgi:hypothetical protein